MSRIVAGLAGGRRLETPSGDSTRPTSDRVREAFFNVLASWNGSGDLSAEQQLDGLAFLDLYAGSGAVGLEAASRGAERVVLVESNPRAAAVIRRNIEASGLPAQLRQGPVETTVSVPNPDPAFDVVWLDPPYGVDTAKLDAVLESVLAQGWVRPDGVVIVERAGRSSPPAVPGTESWSRRYGDTTLYWFAPVVATGEGTDSTTTQEE